MYLNSIKRVYSTLIDNINLDRKKLKEFPLKSGQDKVVHSLHPFNVVLEVSARTMKQLKEIKRL